MVLVVLGLLWAAFLAPYVMKRLPRTQRDNAVGDFHRHLRVLGRAGPNLVPPAHRMRARAPQVVAEPAMRLVPAMKPILPRSFLQTGLQTGDEQAVVPGSRHGAAPGESARAPGFGEDAVGDAWRYTPEEVPRRRPAAGTRQRPAPVAPSRARRGAGRPPVPAVAPTTRAETVKRRQTVAGVLAGGLCASLVFGFVPGLGLLLVVALLFAVALGAYLFMLARVAQTREELREQRLRQAYMPSHQVHQWPLLDAGGNEDLLARRWGT
ncbi:MAG: hypothetical protein ACYDH5_07480 [Acidimicrobiales bacterium]